MIMVLKEMPNRASVYQRNAWCLKHSQCNIIDLRKFHERSKYSRERCATTTVSCRKHQTRNIYKHKFLILEKFSVLRTFFKVVWNVVDKTIGVVLRKFSEKSEYNLLKAKTLARMSL